MFAVVWTGSWFGMTLAPRYTPAVGVKLNPIGVVGVFGEIGAACMTRRNVLDTIRATYRVEGTARTGAVGVTQALLSVLEVIDF